MSSSHNAFDAAAGNLSSPRRAPRKKKRDLNTQDDLLTLKEKSPPEARGSKKKMATKSKVKKSIAPAVSKKKKAPPFSLPKTNKK